VGTEDKNCAITLGALGTIKKVDQNRQLLPDNRSAVELQKITLMSTAYSNHRVLGEIALICCWDLDLPGDCHLITNRGEYI
jgi:hypothetical protein